MRFAVAASALLLLSAAPALGFAPTAPPSSRRLSSFVPRSYSAVPSALRSSAPRTPSSPSSRLSMYTVGVVGATGAVGKEIVGCLERSSLPVTRLRIFGSSRSAGTVRPTGFGDVEVEPFDASKAGECDVVFLAVSGDFALEHADEIIDGEGGAVVIDNSSAFRYDPNVPLVVPEINAETTKGAKLIANPNCTTAIALMALWPLHKLFKLKRVIVSTYQAASGAGQPGMDELFEQTKAVVNGERDVADCEVFAHPLPFNVIPHIDKFQDNGYTKEEMKVTWETRKICGLPDDFPISCTAVRIPTSRAHSESISIETELPVDVDTARDALASAPGVKLVDDTEGMVYPMPLTAAGRYDVEVGRVRRSLAFDNGLELFVSGDQLLRGAALNAVLVAEAMDRNGDLGGKGAEVEAP